MSGSLARFPYFCVQNDLNFSPNHTGESADRYQRNCTQIQLSERFSERFADQSVLVASLISA